MTFRERLTHAAKEGVVLGVKWGIALVMVGGIFLLAIGDYAIVRRQAQQGAEAFLYIQKTLQAQKP